MTPPPSGRPASTRVAFLWHMHQPSYIEPGTADMALPWVRLHSARAYHDMAWMLLRHPRVQCTVNFVPVLLEQIDRYLAGGQDRYLELSRRAAEALTAAERAFLLEFFFSVNLDTGIRPRPRYWNLHQRRERLGVERAAQDLTDDEIRDLQVLFNLAWCGYAAHADFPVVATLEAQGRGFSEAQKLDLLDIQIQILARIGPMYRELAERGQIELTTTPYYHPILPLILDSEVAARCQPDRPRPPRFAFPEDAEAHVARAVRAHEAAFGAPPVGAWPAEGSVSPEVVPLFARHGVRWIATDESQLWRSVDGTLPRGALYQPWRIQTNEGPVDAVFRDHGLSDLIGFTYARNPADVAVDDLLARVRGCGRAARDAGVEDPLVLIALDGENPWEYFVESGRPFLERLYLALAGAPDLPTTTVAAHLARQKAPKALGRLHTGSWINGDFGIWMGGAVENAGWRVLGEARRAFEVARATLPEADRERAYAHLLQAEGSDWFWWYGDTFHSANDADFDRLFRGHLRAAWRAMGREAPPVLDRSLYPPADEQQAHAPRAFVAPAFDRDTTYLDWVGAGLVDLEGAGSSMYSVTRWFGRLRYGFDLDSLYLRLEPSAGRALDLAGLSLRVRVHGRAEHFLDLPLDLPSQARLWRLGPDLSATDGRPCDRVKVRHSAVEFGLRFTDLDAAAGDKLMVTVHLLREKVELDRYPPGRELLVTVPDVDFEAQNWSV